MIKFRTMRSDAEAMLKGDSQLYRKYVENTSNYPKARTFV